MCVITEKSVFAPYCSPGSVTDTETETAVFQETETETDVGIQETEKTENRRKKTENTEKSVFRFFTITRKYSCYLCHGHMFLVYNIY